MTRYGVPVLTGHGTQLTIEFDSEDDALAFRSNLRRAGRLHAEMMVAADTVEHVMIELPDVVPEVQPIVRLTGAVG